MYSVPTEVYTLSLHDALPICAAVRALPRGLAAQARRCRPAAPRHGPPRGGGAHRGRGDGPWPVELRSVVRQPQDRKSTRLNSSHLGISYAVFCLKKKKHNDKIIEDKGIIHECTPSEVELRKLSV